MLEAFLTYINTQKLFDLKSKILLAVSGGIDSVVIVDLFIRAKVPFGIAHCNFGLRGEESNDDEIFVKKIALKHKIPFFTTSFDTDGFAKKEHVSIQMAARMLRYSWFEQIREQHNYEFIATAHHQNDALETVLLNLAKGTGLAGMHGIKPKNNNIVRPLLFADKEQIHEYVVENQLVWREDSSNDSIKYQRNFVRHELVPLFNKLNPGFEETIKRTIAKINDVEVFLEKEVEKFESEIIHVKDELIYISIEKVMVFPHKHTLFMNILGKYNFNYNQSLDILNSLHTEAGKIFISPTHTLLRDRDFLIVTNKNIVKDFASITFEIESLENLNLKVYSSQLLGRIINIDENYKVSTNKAIANIDYNALKNPLNIRKWKEGDWFCPLGMNKKKSITDFLNDQKVPLNQKKDILLLTSNGSVVWIIGYRIDNRFKIGKNTEKIVFLEKK